jgi:hypothetical protein
MVCVFVTFVRVTTAGREDLVTLDSVDAWRHLG